MSHTKSASTSRKKPTISQTNQSCTNFKVFLQRYRNKEEAAKALGCCYFTVRRIANKTHPINLELAKKIEVISEGEIKIEDLMPWIFDHRKIVYKNS